MKLHSRRKALPLSERAVAAQEAYDGGTITLPSSNHGAGYFLYFIQAEAGGPIKIGRAGDLAKRFLAVQHGNPERLVVRRAIEMNRAVAVALEATLHRELSQWRLVGEWFLPTPALVDACGGRVNVRHGVDSVRLIMERAYAAGAANGSPI